MVGLTILRTVEPPIVNSPKQGHSITNLSTKDMTYSPSIIPTIHFEPPKEDNLSTKNKSAEFMLSPKCPLFRGSTVLYIKWCIAGMQTK